MAMKEDLHKLKITGMVGPISEAPGTKMTTTATANCLDTKNYESNMLVLTIGAAGVTNAVFTLYENDTSTATQGTAVTGRDVIFAVDNDSTTWLGTTSAGLFSDATGTLTATTDPVGRTFMFAYTGTKRYVRLVASAGSSLSYSLHSVQGHFRYQGRDGLHDPAYSSVL